MNNMEKFPKIFEGEAKSNLIIFEMGHKPWEQKSTSDIIVPLQVNAHNSPYNLCDLRDDTGDNISELNALYGETTGIYWIWKNVIKNPENRDIFKYVGQTTYRRPFMMDEDFNFEKLFFAYDAVIPEKFYFDKPWDTVASQYEECHNLRDLECVADIIKEFYPDYRKAVDETLCQNYIYNANGFIFPFDEYDKYCSFLFDVMFEWQKRNGIETIDDMMEYVSGNFDEGVYKRFGPDEKKACVSYQVRALGFLSERIFSIYVNHNFSRPFIVPYKNFVY